MAYSLTVQLYYMQDRPTCFYFEHGADAAAADNMKGTQSARVRSECISCLLDGLWLTVFVSRFGCYRLHRLSRAR